MMDNVYEKRDVVERYELSRSIPEHILQSYAERIVRATGATSMCEVGFGKGSTLVPFSSLVPSVGIDSSHEMCAYVAARYPYIRLIEGDAAQIASLLPPQHLIHLKAVLHLPQNPCAFVDALVAGLQPGGYLAIGREVSQPEDNLEDIGEHPSPDAVLADFYSTYFSLRRGMGKPFVRPAMPAGSLREVSRYPVSRGLQEVTRIQTESWTKQITLDQLLTSMAVGTFSVFSKGLTASERTGLAQQMRSYCASRAYDTAKTRSYDAWLECALLRRND